MGTWTGLDWTGRGVEQRETALGDLGVNWMVVYLIELESHSTACILVAPAAGYRVIHLGAPLLTVWGGSWAKGGCEKQAHGF